MKIDKLFRNAVARLNLMTRAFIRIRIIGCPFDVNISFVKLTGPNHVFGNRRWTVLHKLITFQFDNISIYIYSMIRSALDQRKMLLRNDQYRTCNYNFLWSMRVVWLWDFIKFFGCNKAWETHYTYIVGRDLHIKHISSIVFIIVDVLTSCCSSVLSIFFPCTTTCAGLGSYCFRGVDKDSQIKRFGFSFICETIKFWNSLPAYVFPSH